MKAKTTPKEPSPCCVQQAVVSPATCYLSYEEVTQRKAMLLPYEESCSCFSCMKKHTPLWRVPITSQVDMLYPSYMEEYFSSCMKGHASLVCRHVPPVLRIILTHFPYERLWSCSSRIKEHASFRVILLPYERTRFLCVYGYYPPVWMSMLLLYGGFLQLRVGQ